MSAAVFKNRSESGCSAGTFRLKGAFRHKLHRILKIRVSQRRWRGTLLCLQGGLGLSCVASCGAGFSASVEEMDRGKILFLHGSQGGRGHRGRQRGVAALVSTSATQRQADTHTHAHTYLSVCLLFYVCPHDGTEMQVSIRECLCILHFFCCLLKSLCGFRASVSPQHRLQFNTRTLFLFSSRPIADSLSVSK